jgi:hypothetical protein
MQEITGETMRISPLTIAPFPSGNIRLRAYFPNDPRVHVVAISLTPIGLGPYRIDYALELPKTKDEEAVLKQTDLPSLPTLDQIP